MRQQTELWTLIQLNSEYAQVTQMATGVIRTVMARKLPSWEGMAAMTEGQFNTVCRTAFHNLEYRDDGRGL